MTAEEFAKATNKTVDEVKKQLGIIDENIEKDNKKQFTNPDKSDIINTKNIYKINLSLFKEDNKENILNKIKIGLLDKETFYNNYTYFNNKFKNGVSTPIEIVNNSKDSYWHIIDRHEDMLSKIQTDRIIKCLKEPDGIYITTDMFGNKAKCYVLNSADSLLVIVRDGIVTAYKPKKAYLEKIIKRGELIWNK